MNAESTLYNDQVEKLLRSIDNYSKEIDTLSSELIELKTRYNAGEFIDYYEFAQRQKQMKRLSKKIEECTSTIAFLSDKITYTIEDFQPQAGYISPIHAFHCRSEFTNFKFPSSYKIGTAPSVSLTIKNVGRSTWEMHPTLAEGGVIIKYIIKNNYGEVSGSGNVFPTSDAVVAQGQTVSIDTNIQNFPVTTDGRYEITFAVSYNDEMFDRTVTGIFMAVI